MMNFSIVELRQLKKPQQNETLTQPIFSIDSIIYYEVHYFPNNLYMNLGTSRYRSSFELPVNDSDLRRKIFTEFLNQTLIPESQFDSIINTFSSKATSVASDSRNSGYNFIPLSLSIRVISRQPYNTSARDEWDKILESEIGCRFSAHLPAMEKSVQDLEKAVYSGELEEEEDSGSGSSECPICLKGFKVGEERTRLPCFHYYHRDCIVKWLKKSHLCPSCRFPFPVCRVVEGAFPFYKRNHGRRFLPAAAAAVGIGGKIIKLRKPRMSTKCQFY